MGKVCVITGGTGYVGSHVARHLLDAGWECHLPVRSPSDLSNLKGIEDKVHIFTYERIDELISHFNQICPEVVFHLAAAVLTNDETHNMGRLIHSNILYGTEILEAMKECGCKLIVNTGTYWQYYNSDTYNPRDLYSATKEAFEKILQYYEDAYGFRAINLRLYDIYGEDDQRPKLWNVLRDIAGTDKTISVSPGEQQLDIVHISDVCSAYSQAYRLLSENKQITGADYAVCTGDFHTLKEWIANYENACGKTIHVNFGGKPYRFRESMIPRIPIPVLPGWCAIKKYNEMFNNVKQGGVKLA